MTKTCCDRCSSPGPMRWLHAGRDLSRPNGIHQRADRTLRRFGIIGSDLEIEGFPVIGPRFKSA